MTYRPQVCLPRGQGRAPYLLQYLDLLAEIREEAEDKSRKALIWELPGHLVWCDASETSLWWSMMMGSNRDTGSRRWVSASKTVSTQGHRVAPHQAGLGLSLR